MSIEISLMLTDNNDLSGEYCVKKMHGCTVIFGSIPMQDLSGLLKVTKRQFCDSRLAKTMGAVLVYGTKEDLDRLSKDVAEGKVTLPVKKTRKRNKAAAKVKINKRDM